MHNYFLDVVTIDKNYEGVIEGNPCPIYPCAIIITDRCNHLKVPQINLDPISEECREMVNVITKKVLRLDPFPSQELSTPPSVSFSWLLADFDYF